MEELEINKRIEQIDTKISDLVRQKDALIKEKEILALSPHKPGDIIEIRMVRGYQYYNYIGKLEVEVKKGKAHAYVRPIKDNALLSNHFLIPDWCYKLIKSTDLGGIDAQQEIKG